MSFNPSAPPLRVRMRVSWKICTCMPVCTSECNFAHARERANGRARVCMCMFSTSKVPEWTDITILMKKRMFTIHCTIFFSNVLKYQNALRPSMSYSDIQRDRFFF